mmetsp:Transcript_13950/g.16881  ORF Transcript_13950/g.16881 Transcript_13950/m.16881 type:complete len:129 (+) Transcript_13950:149-535(+)|eukprot:CAMPEP_0195256898 /NCGR_PEP_ID=MMETSP0706-20130129/6497_1 /TAXON_ID=33640 /ORGANISM="Asterionellopsis glacialis, Strain CCMP134" /LENGTH=128 /DNA_ID=CAMNT_0040310003 /DNA_START=265 /DNA_END=651 /DNA_ORIENTATION=+
MDNLAPADLAPDELPAGFSAGGSDDKSSEEKSRDAQKEAVLEQALTAEALERLRRIKLVKKEKATAVEQMIVSMALQRKLAGKINEGKLIEMLEGLGAKQTESNNKISIQRKKYAFDSDDEDDDDDLL